MDAELVGRAARGDARAQERIVRCMAPRLLRLAARLGCDEHLAEDLVSEALYRGVVELPKLRDRNAAAAWFGRILVHRLRDALRARGRRPLERLEETSPVPDPAPDASPVARFDAVELRERLEDALELLPPVQRAVVALHWQEGMSVVEIGHVLGSTPDRVKASLWHARRKLRQAIADESEGRSGDAAR